MQISYLVISVVEFVVPITVFFTARDIDVRNMILNQQNVWYTTAWYVMWIGQMVVYVIPIAILMGYLIDPAAMQPSFTYLMTGVAYGAPIYAFFVNVFFALGYFNWTDHVSLQFTGVTFNNITVLTEWMVYLGIQLVFMAVLLI